MPATETPTVDYRNQLAYLNDKYDHISSKFLDGRWVCYLDGERIFESPSGLNAYNVARMLRRKNVMMIRFGDDLERVVSSFSLDAVVRGGVRLKYNFN